MAAGTGTHVHNKVRGAHGILVMLHHDQGVADVPQVLQGQEQLVVVPLVQTDGGLIQNIQHAHQGRTDLGRQPDPLAFAAGKGARRPGKGQIAQAHIRQELEPGSDLLHDLVGDGCHIALQTEVVHKVQLVPDAHAAEIHNADSANGNRAGNVAEAVAAALGTGGRGHAFLQLLPGRVGLGLPVAAGDIVQDALKGLLQHTHAVAPVVGHPQLFPPGAIEDHIQSFPGQLLHGNRQGEMVLLGQGLEVHPEDGIGSGALPAGGLDGTLKNRFVLIRDHQIRIRHQPEAQAGAAGAGTGRIVEGEHPGLQLRQADTAVLTGIVLGEVQFLLGGGQFNAHQSPGMGAGGFDGIRQTAANSLLQHQPVHHQLNGMLFVLFRLDLLRQIIKDPVYPDTGKALLPGILKDLLMLALLSPDHRGKDNKPGPLAQRFNPVHDLVDGLAGDLLAALGAMGNTHSGPQKAKIIIYFRNRTHGGTGIFGSSLLVNGDSGRQALDGIHIRLVHLAQELPGIGGQAFHIPPLTFGINGVESQAGFSGAGQAGEYHQFVSGDGQVNVLQVVFSGTLNDQLIVHIISSACVSAACFTGYYTTISHPPQVLFQT